MSDETQVLLDYLDRRTTDRHDELLAHGVFPLHFPPKRIKTDAPGIIRQIRRAIEKGLQRPPLAIKGLPSVV